MEPTLEHILRDLRVNGAAAIYDSGQMGPLYHLKEGNEGRLFGVDGKNLLSDLTNPSLLIKHSNFPVGGYDSVPSYDASVGILVARKGDRIIPAMLSSCTVQELMS